MNSSILLTKSISSQYLTSSRIWSRSLSNAQLSTALRPFYFLVHPDLFGKYPQPQVVNETSLKSLKNYLNLMIDQGVRPPPISITFYLKPHQKSRHVQRSTLNSVTIHLNGRPEIRQTLSQILKAVNLPTSYVDSLPDTKVKNQSTFYDTGFHDDDYQYSKNYRKKSFGVHPTDIKQPLTHWLTKNVEEVRKKLAACVPIRLEIEKIQDSLINELNLVDILWDCDLETTHRRGALDSFRFLTQSHSEINPIIEGKSIVFGRHSGYDLDGRIIIYNGEVRYNWLNMIKRIPDEDYELKQIPRVEETLSRSLRNIRVVHRKFQPITLVQDYKTRLRKLLTNINDYRSRQNYPESWPESLSHLELCVEAEASPLMISPYGEFIVPASTPGFLLVKFLSDHMEEAALKLSVSKSQEEQEENFIYKVINELGLIQLDKDDSITSDAMIQCCQRLLRSAGDIRHLMHGNHLVITRYYSVLSDGSICIPWNWN